MKKVLVITSSYRKNSNSCKLADKFASGAIENGNNVEIINLAEKQISFCRGCLACQKLGKCVINDDAVEIAEKMKNADVIAFASPVYYYSICGQLKTLLDRANPLYGSDYKFKDVYLFATAAEDEDYTVAGSVTAIQGWVDCFERCKLSKVIFAGGVNEAGDISGHKALNDAYILGKQI